ncbi:MAG TPA: efflux RND transporter periplasmic adaptor subunit [Pyrinomonadaceae bacterium]|nr:efflux RND transporter periplasmic adaptor subunit [Pyrinomonadaceae bacterium]
MNDEPAAHNSAADEARPTKQRTLTIKATEVVAADGQRRRRRQLLIVSALALLVILLVGAVVWRERRTTTTTEEETAPVVSVRVAKVEQQAIAAQVSALGTIFPHQEASVAPKISAQIKQMSLLKNKVVQAGEVLAVLEARDLVSQRQEAVAALGEARAGERSTVTGTIPQNNAQDQKALRDARAAVNNAQAIYNRRLTLYNQGGISKKDLEQSQLDLTKAQDDLRLAEQTVALRTSALNPNERAQAAARVNQAEQHLGALDAQMGYSVIRAPFTGVVTDQFMFQGDFAAAGSKIVELADISQVIVKAPFADTVAAQLKVGDTAAVLPTDMPGEAMHGQITLISRASDPTSRTVEVWVTLANEAGRLRANGAAQVTISTNAKTDALVVPASAVTLDASNANEGTVLVVDDKAIAHETKVTVGIHQGDKMEITNGLQEGATVVVEGNYALPDGTKVEVNEGEKPEADEKGGAEKKGAEKQAEP